jgi:hypothetical protein
VRDSGCLTLLYGDPHMESAKIFAEAPAGLYGKVNYSELFGHMGFMTRNLRDPNKVL